MNFLLLFTIFSTSSYYYLSSLKSVEPIKNYFLSSLQGSLPLVLQMNGLFLSLIINNSLLNDREQSFLPTILSYPVPREYYFITKTLIYIAFDVLINSIIVLLILINNSVGFDISLYLLIVTVFLLNILLATTLVLLVNILIKNFFMSNLLLFIFWSLFLSFITPVIRGLNTSPIFSSFFDPALLIDAYMVNDLVSILLGLLFSVLVTGISFYVAVAKFKSREIV